MNARQWTNEALENVPWQDGRESAEPGLKFFAERMAYVWKTFGKVPFTASKNRAGAPDFIQGILEAGGIKCSRARALSAAQKVVSQSSE